jgi:hypothetical protein
MPDRLPPLEYPDRFEVRYVSANGGIRWNRRWVNVSTVCVGEYVGLEEIADGIWNVYFGPLHGRAGRLTGPSMGPSPSGCSRSTCGPDRGEHLGAKVPESCALIGLSCSLDLRMARH